MAQNRHERDDIENGHDFQYTYGQKASKRDDCALWIQGKEASQKAEYGIMRCHSTRENCRKLYETGKTGSTVLRPRCHYWRLQSKFEDDVHDARDGAVAVDFSMYS